MLRSDPQRVPEPAPSTFLATVLDDLPADSSVADLLISTLAAALREGATQIAQDFRTIFVAIRAGSAQGRRFLRAHVDLDGLRAWAALARSRDIWQETWKTTLAETRLLREAVREGGAQLADDLQPLWRSVQRRIQGTPVEHLWLEARAASTQAGQRLIAVAREHAARLAPAVRAAWDMARVRVAASGFERLWEAACARAAAAGAPILERARRLPQPALIRYLVLADAALGTLIIALLLLNLSAYSALWSGGRAPASFNARAMSTLLERQPPAAGRIVWAPMATPTPRPTASPTPEPVLTATPIPIVYTTWDSTLPLYGGWNGVSECWGSVLAPVGSGVFVWPTDKHYLVGKNYNARWHPGLDLGGEIGDPIYAADSGVVVYAGWNVYGFGNLVILDHGNGWHTLYAHLSQINVACGQAIQQGATLGLAGSTGHSTGPHLHFEMRYGGVNVSPWSYLP